MIVQKLKIEVDHFNDLVKNGFVNYEIVDINLPTFIYSIQFIKLSPFRLKFSESDTRVKEFGLDMKWASDLKVLGLEKKSIDISGDNKVLIHVLILVITLGGIISFIFSYLNYLGK